MAKALGTVVLDVRCRRNRNPFFWPLQKTLQTELRASEISSDKVPGLINQVGGVLPGERMEVDFQNRTCRVYHLLETPEYKDLKRRAAALLRTEQGGFQQGTHFGEEYTVPFREEDVATWLYWIRRLVDSQKLHIVSGHLPSLEEIRAYGDVCLGDDNGLTTAPGKGRFNYLEKSESKHAARAE